MKKLLRTTIILIALAALLAVGCSKKEGAEQKSSTTAKTEPATVTGELAKTVAVRIPPDAAGFLLWDGTNPAYTKLLNSPWSDSGELSGVITGASPEMKRTSELLSSVGLSLDDKEVWRKVFGQAAFFILPKETHGEPVIGAVFRSDGVDLKSKLDAVKAQLSKDPAAQLQEFDVAGSKGFSIVAAKSPESEAQPPAGARVYFAATSELGAISNDQQVINQALEGKPGELPQLVKTKHFEQAVTGLPESSERFAFAYFDTAKIAEGTAKLQADQAVNVVADPDLKAVSIALSMADAPQTDFRLVYDPTKLQGSWLGVAASGSSAILNAVPGKPLFFMSMDGASLKTLKDRLGVYAAQGQPDLMGNLAFVDSVKRLGIAARLAPVGAAMLPVPDIMVALESSDPAGAVPQLEKLIGSAVQSSGGGVPMDWTEKDINGVKVKGMMSPLGVGVFLATTGNLVVLTSNEQQMREVLGGKDKGTFEKNLQGRVGAVVAQQHNIGNFYVNFEEMGSLLENMGGLLVMFAPQNQDSSKLLQPENIQAIKKMGTMAGAVTVDDGVVGIQTFYHSDTKA